MAILHLRELPEETADILKIRAARAGQSLQEYVRRILEREASLLTGEEAAERASAIAARSALANHRVVNAVAEVREPRERERTRL
ncbi:hypothetical protein [Streptomyces sp. ST2-7A]|uniref:FitA-like ribbon-helix-helix domain-containing protein n=1 Tax=Streptomyces sp. ST2-7A TaxID=2907214 RepID=UPI001F2892DE|nr:hypothetical protein [Streptomyces sp. ST2-7A]MCE7081874.1 hypothetical protein [Streptomyces sp. ST2-7A]